MKDHFFNIHNSEDKTLTLLLGIEKPILKDFRFNNIQINVGNEFDYYPDNISVLSKIVKENCVEIINIIGISKTCTAAIVIASMLADKFDNIPICLFSFSPYTTIRQEFYRNNDLMNKIPRSLNILWDKENLGEEVFDQRDQKILENYENVRTFIMYPLYGVHCEPECVSYVADLENVTLVPFAANTHAVLFPFWSRLKWDLRVELFEGEYSNFDIQDYWYFLNFQKTFVLKESLYLLIFDHNRFTEKLETFNRDMKHRKIPVYLLVVLACLQRLLKVRAFIIRNVNKINRSLKNCYIRP